MPLSHFDMECGPRCRSKRHAQELNAAITRGNLKEIQAYFKLCYNAGVWTDTVGRTVLHLAASCGKLDVVEWLLTTKKPEMSTKDEESGWTALHRAIFYGQLGVARLLLQEVNDLTVRDREGLGALDIIQKDRPSYVTFSPKDQSEVYSWGDNSNLTLGHSVEQRRAVPEVVDTFRRLQINIKQVELCKYHTVFLTSCGKVFTCGHGQGGRLGHNDEQACLVPRVVAAIEKETCVQVAAARDHTVFLMEGGTVYTCGLNDCHQLGQFPLTQKCLAPKPVNAKVLKGKRVISIGAGRFHTVITTSGSPDAVYTFGLNAGQLGHPKGEVYQSQPRQVAYLNHEQFSVEKVVCSDAAIVCITQPGDIYVLHEYQCRRISGKWQDTKKIEVSGGHLDHHTDRDLLREYGGTELNIALLNSTGKVLVWKQSSQTMKRCQWAVRRPLYVTDMSLSSQNLVIITEEGEGFVGHFSHRKYHVQSQNKHPVAGGGDNFANIRLLDLLLKDEVEDVQIHRIPLIYRATTVSTDRKGRNYVITQTTPNSSITDVPCISQSSMVKDLRVLLEEVDQGDTVHDAIIKAGHESFPVHKYILAYRSDHFRKQIDTEFEMGENVSEICLEDDVHPALLQQLLQFIYTDTCDLLRIGARFDPSQVQHYSASNDIFHFEPHIVVNDTPAKENGFHVPAQKTKPKRKKKNGMKSNSTSDEHQNKLSCVKTPVKMLQDLAKKYSIKGLAKRLDCVKLVDGVVQSNGKSIPKPNIRFDRRKLASLYDVSIKAEDGTVVQCHKCIAVARLEYFHSMMASGWIETSNTSALSLPIPGDILETVLDFLYVGDSPAIRGSTDVERLCNVLVVADQLLITVLKEICEVSLASLLTLRNAGDMLEFASMYNASQLKATSQQYICLNLGAILEARALEVLSDDVMADLTKYYREMIPAMCRRQITPYDEGPSRDFLEALAEDYQGDDGEEFGGGDSGKKKPKTRKKRGRHKSVSEESNTHSCSASLFGGWTNRQTSISSETSIKSDEDDMEAVVIAEECIQQQQQLQSSGAFGSVTVSKFTENQAEYNPWNMASSPPLAEFSAPTSPRSDIGLRGIMNEEVRRQDHSHKSAGVTPKKSTKLSQKERKKLAAQSPASPVVETQLTKGGLTPPWSTSTGQTSASSGTPWGGVSHVVKSFRDLMLEDTDVKVVQTTSPRVTGPTLKSPTSPVSGSVLSWGLPTSTVQRGKPSGGSAAPTPVSPSSPTDNPWLSKSPPAAAASLSFTEIVKDERERQDNLVRSTNKPLHLIQIEERAIQELMGHYRVGENFDELITVERVSSAAAAPLWAVNRKNQGYNP